MKKTVYPALILFLALAAACSLAARHTPEAQAATNASLANGYSLLYSLLKDESQVDGILKIKKVSEPTQKLIREIAAVSRRAATELDKLAALKPPVSHDTNALPLVEAATRKSIAMQTTWDLLTSIKTVEVKILLTQIQAANYGQYLAKELQDLDPNKERKKWLKEFAKEYEKLHNAMVDRLATK